MAANSFGNIFRITTFGESHGAALGVVIDGCPAGVQVCLEEINQFLSLRAPGRNKHVTSRCEPDEAEILSGVFEGRSTGAPICILIRNQDANSKSYDELKDVLRPGHANYTYMQKYDLFDHRGGGRASGRETVARVAAGAIAFKYLQSLGIDIAAYISRVGAVNVDVRNGKASDLRLLTYASDVYCPDQIASEKIKKLLSEIRQEGDSIGGTVSFTIDGVPPGIGDPIFEKLSAKLAYGMMSIPAVKGFEIGDGFAVANQRGSENNDCFIKKEGVILANSNHAGGLLGGISNGMPIYGRVAFKPTPSIYKAQKTIDIRGNDAELKMPSSARHDPCVAIRAVPVVEAMCAISVMDAILLNRTVKSSDLCGEG